MSGRERSADCSVVFVCSGWVCATKRWPVKSASLAVFWKYRFPSLPVSVRPLELGLQSVQFGRCFLVNTGQPPTNRNQSCRFGVPQESEYPESGAEFSSQDLESEVGDVFEGVLHCGSPREELDLLHGFHKPREGIGCRDEWLASGGGGSPGRSPAGCAMM